MLPVWLWVVVSPHRKSRPYGGFSPYVLRYAIRASFSGSSLGMGLQQKLCFEFYEEIFWKNRGWSFWQRRIPKLELGNGRNSIR